MIANQSKPAAAESHADAMTLDVIREFHRRMAAMIDAVQVGIWERKLPELLGYATDYGLGQQRGVQTLVLKTRHRSSYVRLNWDTVMGDGIAEKEEVETTIARAITELS